MTSITKKVAIEQLEKAHEEIYDADQLLGGLRITKETAECLREITRKLVIADSFIVAALDNLA